MRRSIQDYLGLHIPFQLYSWRSHINSFDFTKFNICRRGCRGYLIFSTFTIKRVGSMAKLSYAGHGATRIIKIATSRNLASLEENAAPHKYSFNLLAFKMIKAKQ